MARCGLGEASSLISGGWGQGHPMDLFPKISVLQAKFCWLGNLEKLMSLEVKCCWAIHNSGCHRGFGVYNSLYVLFVYLSSPHWRGECLPYAPPDCLCTRPPPPPKLKGWILPCIHTQGALRCTSLVGNSSISLTGSEKQINSSQQSSKMLKMASGILIYAFLLFLRLFLKFPVGCLCGVFAEENKWKIQDPFLHIIFFCPYL